MMTQMFLNKEHWPHFVETKIHLQLAQKGGTGVAIDLHTHAVYWVSIPPADNRRSCPYLRLEDVELDDGVRRYYKPAMCHNGEKIDAILPPRVCIQSTIARRHLLTFETMLKVTEKLLVSRVRVWGGFFFQILTPFLPCP